MEDKDLIEQTHYINLNTDESIRIYTERNVLFEEDGSTKRGVITFYFNAKPMIKLEAVRIEKELPVVGMKTMCMYYAGIKSIYGIDEFDKLYANQAEYIKKLKKLYSDLDVDLIKMSHTILGFIGENIDYSLKELEAFKKI